jgi:hypothetical protein
MKKVLLILLSVLFILSFAGCSGVSQEAFEQLKSENSQLQQELDNLKGQSDDSEVAEEPEEIDSAEPADSPAPAASLSSSGTIDEYKVKILNCEVIKNYEKKPAVRIYFEFTNNSSKTDKFMMCITTICFQNGVQLDTSSADKDAPEDNNAYKDIKPGTTIKCADVFLIQDNSPIEVYAGEFAADTDECTVKKSFTLK